MRAPWGGEGEMVYDGPSGRKFGGGLLRVYLTALLLALAGVPAAAQTSKPLLHGQHWRAITGKPLAAAAGARMFEQGGNAIDAACGRFYRGDIAEAFVAGSHALGGLHTVADLADWEVKIEEPLSVRYKGIRSVTRPSESRA